MATDDDRPALPALADDDDPTDEQLRQIVDAQYDADRRPPHLQLKPPSLVRPTADDKPGDDEPVRFELIPPEHNTAAGRAPWVDGFAASHALHSTAARREEVAHRRELEALKAKWALTVALLRIEHAHALGNALRKFETADRLAKEAREVIEQMKLDAAATTGRLEEARRMAPDPLALMQTLAGLVGQMQSNAAVPQHFVPVPQAVESATPGVKSSPDFSAVASEFIAGSRTRKAYTETTLLQIEMTVRNFVELIGDGPIRDIDGEAAGKFIDLLRRLPASHGKSRNRISAPDAIAAADAKPTAVPRLSEKTVKRHVSAMSVIWRYAQPRRYVDSNSFSGFIFHGTKSNRRKRDAWSGDDVRALFSKPWRSNHVSADTFKFVFAIAAYTGMRLEEICRLRPKDDFVTVGGVFCIEIQDHPDGWSPKTDAGERLVPVHPELTKLGLRQLVERTAKAGAPYLFRDLKPSGPEDKRSVHFSRDFSRFKKALGVSDRVTFHSWRHNVVTCLKNQPARIRTEWIDAVCGHEPGKTAPASEGSRTYVKKYGIENLNRTVVTIRHDEFDLPQLLRGLPERPDKIVVVERGPDPNEDDELDGELDDEDSSDLD